MTNGQLNLDNNLHIANESLIEYLHYYYLNIYYLQMSKKLLFQIMTDFGSSNHTQRIQLQIFFEEWMLEELFMKLLKVT